MSHISKIELEIRDLDALEKACKVLGFAFIEGQQSYRWYGEFINDYPLPDGMTKEQLGTCDHAIRVPGASYEIGVKKFGDHYKLLYDFWEDGGLVQKIGEDGGPIKQAYTIETTKKSRAARDW
jgi:hypothetical protein